MAMTTGAGKKNTTATRGGRAQPGPSKQAMKRILLLLGLAVSSYLVVAQTVRRADASALPALPNAFRSPMVIETVFPANPSLWMATESLAGFGSGSSIHGALGKPFSTPEWYALGRFTCDGMSLRGDARPDGSWNLAGLTMKVKPLSGAFLVTLDATIYNPTSNPHKAATLFFEVLNGESVIAKNSCKIKTRDARKGGHSGDVRLVLRRDELASATKLRTTMTTIDD